MSFGEKIRQLRLERNWTQEYVAEKLNISVGALSRYESSMYEPKSLSLLKDLSDIYDVSTDYLVGKSDIRNPKTLELSNDDIKFIKNIKELSETEKKIIRDTIEAFLDKEEKED